MIEWHGRIYPPGSSRGSSFFQCFHSSNSLSIFGFGLGKRCILKLILGGDGSARLRSLRQRSTDVGEEENTNKHSTWYASGPECLKLSRSKQARANDNENPSTVEG